MLYNATAIHCSGGLWSCEEIGIGRFPSLHHRKEGWPSDQKMIAKPPLTARPGWFSDENKWKTTPAASASVAARNFLDDAATPPCGRARRGITLDSNLFTAPMSADNQALTLSTVIDRICYTKTKRHQETSHHGKHVSSHHFHHRRTHCDNQAQPA